MATLAEPEMSISLTELARGTSWRDHIDDAGIASIAERGKPIAYVLSPHEFERYVQIVQDAAAQREEDEIRKIFETRAEDKVIPASKAGKQVDDIVAAVAGRLEQIGAGAAS